MAANWQCWRAHPRPISVWGYRPPRSRRGRTGRADGIDAMVRAALWGQAPKREHNLHIFGGYTFSQTVSGGARRWSRRRLPGLSTWSLRGRQPGEPKHALRTTWVVSPLLEC
jgi:hypothetical protein